ncbi:MAG: hypothetical protein LBF86_09500 [Helicobacteraceae bacterium]|nr:hypothetical protein [Helicobacteraceae bacterium]
MDASFAETIQTIVKRYGKEALDNCAKYESYLPTEARKRFSKERHILHIAIKMGAAKDIRESENLAQTKRELVFRLKDQFFIAANMGNETIDLLAYVLRNDNSLKITAAKPTYAQTAPIKSKKSRQKPLIAVAIIAALIIAAYFLFAFRSAQEIQEFEEPNLPKAILV